MDFFTGIVIAALIGYSIFKESPQEKAAREHAERAEKIALRKEAARQRQV